MAQMWVMWSPAMSKAKTVTVVPPRWAIRPGWPLTERSRMVSSGAWAAIPARRQGIPAGIGFLHGVLGFGQGSQQPVGEIDQLTLLAEDRGQARVGRPRIGRPRIGRPRIGRPRIGRPRIGRARGGWPRFGLAWAGPAGA
jgi:hypothetical protein